MNDYSTTLTLHRTPEEVYAAVVDVRSWWTGDIAGPTDVVGEEFTYTYEDKHRSTHRVTELDPGRRVVWLTTEAHLPFASDPAEWNGTTVVFDISEVDDGTQLRFTHVGLVPAFECFTDCSSAWSYFINGSLRQRIERS
jgi:hypothetical protein